MTPRWGLGDAALGYLLGIVGSGITGIIVIGLTGAEEGTDLSLGWLAVAMSGMWLGLLAVPLVAPRVKGNGPIVDLGLRLKPRDVLVGGACGVGAQYLIGLIYWPFLQLFDVDVDEMAEPAREMTERAVGGFGVVMLVLVVGLAAPVVEEIFYRGLLQRAMQRRFGGWTGVLLTSLLFGASHLLGTATLLHLPALVMAGFVFGLLAHTSGRLGPAITAHIAFNMVTVVTLLWWT